MVETPKTDRFQLLQQDSEGLGLISMIKNNLVYILDLSSKNISSSFLVSLNPSDSIKEIRINSELRLTAVLL